MSESFKAPATVDEFMRWVEINEETGCWEWNLSRSDLRGGYGQKVINYKHYRSNRLAWLVFKGEIPKGMFVCHKCDNPPCCNPEHLFLGSPKDNSKDAWHKGRVVLPTNIPVGEKHRNAKLTETDIREIRRRKDDGESSVALAKEFNVSRSLIWNVWRRLIWKHVI